MTEDCVDSRVFRVSAYVTVRILLVGMEQSEAIMASFFRGPSFHVFRCIEIEPLN